LLALVAVALPVAAQDKPDCSVWELKGIRIGMSAEEATKGRDFEEFSRDWDAPDYTSYLWQARGRPEKIDLHVDTRADPTRVIGLGTTVPSADIPPKKYLAGLTERWGEPTNENWQGAFTQYSWRSQECDLDVRVSVMNVDHQVGVWMAMGSISGRAEWSRRKRAAEAADAASEKKNEGGATDTDTAPRSEGDPDGDQ
jgi:hypothetical protein